MRSGKKIALGFLPTLLCLVAMLVSACGQSAVQPTVSKAPASQQHFTYGFDGGGPNGDFSTLDPAQDGDTGSLQGDQMLFSGLVMLDDKLQVRGELADHWTTTPDGLTWTFFLKPNLSFSDGTPLTANDVAYSINRALTPAVNTLSGGLGAGYLNLIKDSDTFSSGAKGAPASLIGDSLIVVDNSTLKIVLTKSTGYFLDALSYPTSWVVEKSVIDKWGNDKWTDHLGDNGGQGGSGPWKVLSYDHNTGLKLVPNTKYFGPAPQLQQVNFSFYSTGDTSFKAYQANQVDQAIVPASQVPTQKAILGSQYHQYPTLIIFYMAFNYLVKPFDNIKIRQAFELAINKDALVHAARNDVDMATCHIVPQGMPGYNPNLQCPDGASTAGDPAKAKQLLQEGMQEEGITTLPDITITYPSSNPAREKIVTILRDMWKTVLGVTLKTQTPDFKDMNKQIAATACATPDQPQKCAGKGLQIWFAGWAADYPDPQDWTTLQFGQGSSLNTFNYGLTGTNVADQVATQKALAAADVLPAGDARYKTYNDLEQKLINDVAWCPLFQYNGNEANKPWVKGWTDNAQQIVPPWDWANIYIAAH